MIEPPKPKTIKKITLFIPIGLPGLGKSTFKDRILYKYFEEYNLKENDDSKKVHFTTICNDTIRQQLLDDFMKENKGETKEKAFMATSSLLIPRIEQELIN